MVGGLTPSALMARRPMYRGLPTRRLILLEFLAQRPEGVNSREIVKCLGWSKRTVQAIVAELRKSGEITAQFLIRASSTNP